MLDLKDYLMCCLSRTSIKNIVPDFFFLDPELELAEKTVLFDQSFVFTVSIIYNIFLILIFDNYNMLNVQYRKNSKIWDTSNNCHNCPKIGKV